MRIKPLISVVLALTTLGLISYVGRSNSSPHYPSSSEAKSVIDKMIGTPTYDAFLMKQSKLYLDAPTEIHRQMIELMSTAYLCVYRFEESAGCTHLRSGQFGPYNRVRDKLYPTFESVKDLNYIRLMLFAFAVGHVANEFSEQEFDYVVYQPQSWARSFR